MRITNCAAALLRCPMFLMSGSAIVSVCWFSCRPLENTASVRARLSLRSWNLCGMGQNGLCRRN